MVLVKQLIFCKINKINLDLYYDVTCTVRLTILLVQDIYAVRIQNEHCHSLKLTNIKTKL